MILEKLHRAINNFNKTFNWRRFRRDALHLGESLLVFGVLYGIFSTLIWGVCFLLRLDGLPLPWAPPTGGPAPARPAVAPSGPAAGKVLPPRRRARCGFGSPKIFLGSKFFEGLPRF